MKSLYLGLGCFLFIYVLYLIMVIFNKKKMKNFFETNQAKYFISKYKLNTKKINPKPFANAIALANSGVIALTLVITEITTNYCLKLLICLIVLFLSFFTKSPLNKKYYILNIIFSQFFYLIWVSVKIILDREKVNLSYPQIHFFALKIR